MYKNEQFVGTVVSDDKLLNELGLKRSDLFITTKVGTADQGKGNCRKSVLESLEKLKLDYIDLVLIHWPGVYGSQPQDIIHAKVRQESWQDLEELCREGKVRSIGVSNYTVDHLKQLLSHCSIRPAVNQVEFHPLVVQLDLLNYCKSEQIVLQAYSSLGSAKGWDILSSNETLKSLAVSKGKSVAQILLRWAINHEVPVIPKSAKEDRVADNFDVFSFDLSDDEMQQIDGLDQNTRFCWDPTNVL